jgi:PD-(D/E)XK nuclease superfamily
VDLRHQAFVSYNLWSQFEPAIGWEDAHCDMQRGWKWRQSSSLKLDTIPALTTVWQKVGQLAQQGLYEFHQDPLSLKHPRGIDRIADRIYLHYEVAPVRRRVMDILQQYRVSPWLLEKDILLLNRGDEPIPAPIDLQVGSYQFQLLVAFDCIIRVDDKIHIIDFKTGSADFDRRQAYVYLLACSYLYPNTPAVASFHNLEQNTQSPIITATPDKLNAIEHKLATIAQLHQQQLQEYQCHPNCFDRIFPPHPGNHCHYCSFNYHCTYSATG